MAATLSGAVAISIAVIAVASMGLLMLAGRIDVRRGTQVILGCFVIFGASAIATGIQVSISGLRSAEPLPEIDSPPTYYPPAATPPPQSLPAVTDPYAGAAVPTH